MRTRDNSDVFNSLDEIYLVFTSKKQISSIYSYFNKGKQNFCKERNIFDKSMLHVLYSVRNTAIILN